MSDPGRTWGTRIGVAAALFSVVSLAIAMSFERAQHRSIRERLAGERRELQSQLEARDLTISQLKAEIRNLRSLVEGPAMTRPRSREPAPRQAEAALRRQLAELSSSHSNTLALAGSLLAEKSGAVAAEETRKANEAVVAELESAMSEAIQNAEAARQKTEELLRTLNVPAGAEATEIEIALSSPNLRAYWPYFEAKREQDLLERVVDALRLRLLQETAGPAPEPAPADNSP